jgi:hypothetical protein
VEVSVLEHILNGAPTMPETQGIFLAETWRFGEKLCAFTSKTFYEGKLHSTKQRQLDRQALAGGPLEGAGLFVREVRHEGNRHTSDEELEAILDLVEALVRPGSKWVDHQGVARQMTSDDILIVSPYNAQVSRLSEALRKGRHSDFAWRIGTVDRFQGQEAPVVIYSMATSRVEDAPRGMEFLYSLNPAQCCHLARQMRCRIGCLAASIRAGVQDTEADSAGKCAVPIPPDGHSTRSRRCSAVFGKERVRTG